MASLAERFFKLFYGLSRSYGVYNVPSGAKPTEKNKLHNVTWARTVHGPLTIELWERHLAGKEGLGVVPIRDDGNTVFGTGDIDIYPLDLVKLVADIKRLTLPLIVCRTKSGGAHCILFLKDPVLAEIVRPKIMEWMVLLGYPGVEVFPKQTRLASENDDGSWINMPYHGGKRSTRYAIKPDGSAMTPEEFLAEAEKIALTQEELEAFEPPKDATFGDDVHEAPPCMQTLSVKGFGDWQNNGMVNWCVYLRKRYGDDDWEHRVAAYNQKFMSPPLGHADLANVIKSARKKKYNYMCKQEPICGVCNKQLCNKREFGVGGGTDDPGVVFGELQVLETDPPTFIWDVDGARIELTNIELMDQRRFHQIVINTLHKWPVAIKPAAWQKIIRDRLERVEILKVPDDATKEGQFWLHLQTFCTSRVQGKSLDELLLGKPYTEEGRTFFCSNDLFQYLAQHRFNVTQKEACGWLRKKGVEHHFNVLKGRGINYWSVAAFDAQTEDHAIPRPESDRM